MQHTVIVVVLGLLTLAFFTAKRTLSLFSWSRLEELAIPRPRRHMVEKCLEDRELAGTCFLVLGSVTFAIFVVVFETALSRTVGIWWAALRVALLALMLIWILPELLAGRFSEKMAIWIVPSLYRVFSLPFKSVRNLIGQPVAQANGENGSLEAESAHEPGTPDAEAHEFFRMAVKSQHTLVREIMTPRTDMVSVPDTAPLARVAEKSCETGYSRFPVYRGNRDQIIGVLHVKDLLAIVGTDQWQESKAADLARPPFFIPETKAISDLMEEFRRSKTHIGIVLDEYGGTSGLVTLEDMMEELVGEIYDEYEKAEEETPLFTVINDRSVEVQAVMRIEEFNEEFDLDLPEEEDFDTLGGFVTFILGKIPAQDETFQVGDARFTVIEADVRHVIRVRVDLKHGFKPREKV